MISIRGMRPAHYEDIEKQLIEIFKDVIFKPIIKIIKESTPQKSKESRLLNAANHLSDALRSGKIQYSSGIFSGKFDSKTTKALMSYGAKWSKNQLVFKIDPSLVPSWIKADAVKYQSDAQLAHKSIISTLDEIKSNLDKTISNIPLDSSDVIESVNKDFVPVYKALQIEPELTPTMKRNMSEEYTQNMKLWIKKWCDSEIIDLREKVEENVFEGLRFDSLIDTIVNRYNVSVSKAKFLARNETSIFVSKFNEERLKDAGVYAYYWSTSNDERVREDHKELNGTLQFFDSPPVADKRTGKRGNPGEIWQCRCVPIPILNLPLVKT